MTDVNLKTFICVAKCGSFAKAAEELFLTPNAVKNRIEDIEKHIDAPLFFRSKKGVELTRAGISFYKDACKILKDYETAMTHLEHIRDDNTEVFRFGMMEHYVDEFLLARKYDAREQFFGMGSSFTFYPTESSGLHTMLAALGKELDVAIDVYDEVMAQEYQVCAEIIDDLDVCIGMPQTHPKNKKESFALEELNGETILIPSRKYSTVWYRLCRKLEIVCPESEVVEIYNYNPKVFCNYLDKNCVFLLTEDWKEIYPFFTYAKLEGNYHIPFAIYYSADATDKLTAKANQLSAIAQDAKRSKLDK